MSSADVNSLDFQPLPEVAPRSGLLKPFTSVERRVALVWGLLLFNVLPYAASPLLITIPSKVGKGLTQGSLVLALILALSVNRRVWIRPNAFLGVFSVLAVLSVMMSIRFIGFGSDIRAARLVGFLIVLWLLTPWWGSDGLLLVRAQLIGLTVAVASAALGFVLAHHKAMSTGRLVGAIWPMPGAQVAHYAAEALGLTLILWMCRIMSPRRTAAMAALCVPVLLLSHARTALLGLVIGLLVALLSLVTTTRRVRKAFGVVIVVIALAGPIAAPVVTNYLARGQNGQEIGQLTGRTKVWGALLAAPRPETNKILGSGLTNESFNGLSIDNSWLGIYLDQGVVGDVLVGAMLVVLLVGAAFAPRSPARALAVFLIVYCLVASYTETGLGDATTYSLDLAVAASLLAAPVVNRVRRNFV